MSRYILVVESAPTKGADAEYNDWYNNTHLGEVLQIKGFTAAQRFAARGEPVAGKSSHPYLAIYEMETDDPQGVLDALGAGVRNGSIHMSDAIDTGNVSAVLFEPVSERVLAPAT